MQTEKTLTPVMASIVSPDGRGMTQQVKMLLNPEKVSVAWGWSGPLGAGVLAQINGVQLYIKADEFKRIWGQMPENITGGVA